MGERIEVLLAGGGLQAGLVALAALHARPEARITIVERGDRLGGNHTWSFHEGDAPEGAEPWIAPLRRWTWPGYDVRFPGKERTVLAPYSSFDSAHLHAVVSERLREAPGGALICGRTITGVDARGATLDDGRRLEADLVIDCRGPEAAPLSLNYRGGYQKFVGLEVELARPHGLDRPLLMDATVPQEDGFRFVYVLPFGPTRALVEDTRFSDGPELDVPALRAGVSSWIAARGWSVQEELREERGVLPMPSHEVVLQPGPPLVGGYPGGWYHPATGYSFPVAARLAAAIAALPPQDVLGGPLRELAAEIAGQQRFGLLLNQLLFDHGRPEDRWHVFRRFYGLPDDVISRFYALRTTRSDRIRTVAGLPPKGVSILGAVGSLLGYVRDRRAR